MKATKLSKLCVYLSDLLEQKEYVRDELLSDFIYEATREEQWDTLDGMSAYLELIDICERYKDFQMTKDDSFAYSIGHILAVEMMRKMIIREETQKSYEREFLPPDSKQFEVLQAIARNPGITHRELAEMVNNEVDALSHTSARLEKRQYIMTTKSGRNKRYFISQRGKALIKNVRSSLNTAENEQAAAWEYPDNIWNNWGENTKETRISNVIDLSQKKTRERVRNRDVVMDRACDNRLWKDSEVAIKEG
jgi:DNA-binding MarR family transcriptional regulator